LRGGADRRSRATVLGLLVFGVGSYSSGLEGGFLTILGGFLFPSASSLSVPVWFFAVYPRFSLVCLMGFPLPSSGFSPFSICFLLLALPACVLVAFGRIFEGGLSALSALTLGGLQYLIVSSTVGFEPLRAGVYLTTTNLLGHPPFGLLIYTSSTATLLASEASLLAVAAFSVHHTFLREAKRAGRLETPLREGFGALRDANTKLTLFHIPLYLLLAAVIAEATIKPETPNYGILLSLLHIFGNNAFSTNVLFLVLLLLPVTLVAGLAYRRLSKPLIERCLPIIRKALGEKAVVTIDELGRILDAEGKAGYFKNFLNSLISESKKSYPLGVYGDYFYAVRPLVRIAEREIEKYGNADLYRLASELLVPPEILTKIYSFLAYLGFIRGFTVTGEGYLTKTQVRRYGWWT